MQWVQDTNQGNVRNLNVDINEDKIRNIRKLKLIK